MVLQLVIDTVVEVPNYDAFQPSSEGDVQVKGAREPRVRSRANCTQTSSLTGATTRGVKSLGFSKAAWMRRKIYFKMEALSCLGRSCPAD